MPAQVQAADGGREYIPILLNGRPLEQNDDIGWAQNVNGRVMVPLRLVSEALGFTVGWQTDGPQMISMRGHGQSVFHRLGTLYARPALTGWDYVAQTDVPSFVDRVTDRTMVGVRLVAEAFNDVTVDWDSANRSVILTTNFAPPDVDDVIWLDDDNFVLRSQVVNRIAQQQVVYYEGDTHLGMPWVETGRTRTLGEQARHWEPFVYRGVSREPVIGRRVLVERATSYFENFFNINYRTMTAEQWTESFFQYVMHINDTYPNPEWPEILEYDRGWFARWFNNRIPTQQLIITAVFVTDESLVHVVPGHIAMVNNLGVTYGGLANWAVRGTLFYKIDSILDAGERNFWFYREYQLGQWNWIDVEARFHMGLRDTVYEELATTDHELIFWFSPDGALLSFDDLAIAPPQPLSALPR